LLETSSIVDEKLLGTVSYYYWWIFARNFQCSWKIQNKKLSFQVKNICWEKNCSIFM